MARVEELIAFNDEVASLARVGVPLELGLTALGKDTDSALGRINATITGRISRGESLADALAAEKESFPAAYYHVVKAGLRCGRLPASLEGLTRYARTLSEVRQRLAAALVYPLIVCAVSYALFILFCLYVVPTLQQSYGDLEVSPGSGLRWATALRDSMPFWVAVPPLLLACMLFVWMRTGGAGLLSFRGLARPLGWLPGIRKTAFEQRCAIAADLLALFVENKVPLHESLRLAADAAGDARLRQAAHALAEAAEQGQSLSLDSPGADRLPPFLGWALTSESEPAPLVESLQLAADTYRRRSEHRAEWLRMMLPLIACVVIGGGATLVYALSLFIPIFQMLKGICS